MNPKNTLKYKDFEPITNIMENPMQSPISLALNGEYDQIQWETLPKQDILECLTHKTKSEDKIIHLIAKSNQFYLIPKNILTKDLLETGGENGKNLFHILSEKKQINLIPEKLITKQSLLTTSHNGETPLHTIAAHRHHLIPEDITLEELLLKTNDGTTILHSWTKGSGWLNIPSKFLTKNSLEVEDIRGVSPINNIIEDYSDGWTNRPKGAADLINTQMRVALKKISYEKLEDLKELPSLKKLVENELKSRDVVKKVTTSELSLEI